MKNKITFLFLVSVCILRAQNMKFETKNNDLKMAALPYYNYGEGLGLVSSDSIFKLNTRFRMQNRVGYIKDEGEESAYEGQVRRLRLRFDGYVVNPKFLYAIQLSFAPGDTGEIKEGENLNIIRDAVVSYRPDEHWNIAFGQTKLPGNRQRVNSSGALDLTDRSINNTKFNIDRDFGFQVYYLYENFDAFSYNIKTAVSTGEGRNWTKYPKNSIAFTAKGEVFPFGTFTKEGDYFEGDIAREKKPKLMLSGVYHHNDKTKKTQGQSGEYLFAEKTMESIFFDAMFKYNGWSLMMAYMSRRADDPVTFDPYDRTRKSFVYVGEGMDYQLSYVFPTNYEIIGRFSTQKVQYSIFNLAPNTNEYSIGVTKYLREHTFKLQTELTFDTLKFYDGAIKNNYYIRFQVEIGI